MSKLISYVVVFSRWQAHRVWLLAPLPFSEVDSAFHSASAVSDRLYSLSMSLSFVVWGV
jgi:hypothetical protein